MYVSIIVNAPLFVIVFVYHVGAVLISIDSSITENDIYLSLFLSLRHESPYMIVEPTKPVV